MSTDATGGRSPRHVRCGAVLAAAVIFLVLAMIISQCGGADTAADPDGAGPSGEITSAAADPSGTGSMPDRPRTPASQSSKPEPSTSSHTTSGTGSADASVSRPRPGTALAAAAALTVKGRAPKTGYDRDQYGEPWIDIDGNGCDQRDDILNRDLTDKTFDGCRVLTGTLRDPYTARTIDFRRGETTSAEVQIDHVVSLSDSWQKGAQQWNAAERVRFANDPLNLLAVDGPTNASKGDGDAATWLPPNKKFRCSYVSRQVAVKKAYGLWVTRAERDAMVRILTRCPQRKLPKQTTLPDIPAGTDGSDTQDAEPSDPNPGSDSAQSGDQCEPGYDPCVPRYPPDLDCSDLTDVPVVVTGDDPHRLDGNGDGLGCEGEH